MKEVIQAFCNAHPVFVVVTCVSLITITDLALVGWAASDIVKVILMLRKK